MIILPSLLHKVHRRPGRASFEAPVLVPDLEQKIFWSDFYKKIFSLSAFSPTRKDIFTSMNPLYSYYGNRMHPVTFEPKYFHIGIELDCQQGQEIKPLMSGILEYSGYGATTGYYVLLSHPRVQTEDGYVLHTMYCHLKKPLVRFSSYQKMLREISLGSYPEIPITKDTVLGYAGGSGIVRKDTFSCYIQTDFRKFDQKPIVINPLSFFTDNPFLENLSADFTRSDQMKSAIKK